jgi:hypothetical protein
LRPGREQFDFGLPAFLSLRKIVIELHLQPNTGDVYGIALASRTVITAKMPARR